MDWTVGVRRAFQSAEAGLWFAVCYAGACAFSLFAARQLGVHNLDWATFAVIMVMRPEGMVSLKQVVRYMVGTIPGAPAATLFAQLSSDYMLAQIVLAAIVAAFGRLGFALDAALGYMAFTVFVILIVELALESSVPPFVLVLERLYDVNVGCLIALVGTLIAGIKIWLRTSK
jgi:uncharacterized membrane protein YccC